jgi:hypothetical protein
MKRRKSTTRSASRTRTTPGREIDDILEATWEPRRRTSAVTRSADAAPGDADDLVDRIVEQLERSGRLNEPRASAGRSIPLPDYLRSEVRRIINNLPLGLIYPAPTADDARQLAEVYRRRGEEKTAMMYAYHAQRGVPEGEGDFRLKLRCAEEAYCLMEWFSPAKPTGSVDGPYFMIAALLYEAATGTSPDNLDTAMKRPCTQWLKYRQRYPNNTPASELPPPPRS